MQKPFDISAKFWDGMTERDRQLHRLVRPQPRAANGSDYALHHVERFLSAQAAYIEGVGGRFELEPDFQRGHVWSDSQRSGYIESLIRGYAPARLLFNCPGWVNAHDASGDIAEHTFQCIDGLQRLTAVRKFMAGEVAVFGELTAADLTGTRFDPRRMHIQICVYEISRRADLLQFYLDLNAGGSVHQPSEIERVRNLLEAAQKGAEEDAGASPPVPN